MMVYFDADTPRVVSDERSNEYSHTTFGSGDVGDRTPGIKQPMFKTTQEHPLSSRYTNHRQIKEGPAPNDIAEECVATPGEHTAENRVIARVVVKAPLASKLIAYTDAVE